jgi:hypothetical protein
MKNRMDKRHEMRAEIMFSPKHTEFMQIYNEIPTGQRVAFRNAITAQGKYANWAIDRKNGWSRISREDIDFMRIAVQEFAGKITKQTSGDRISSEKIRQTAIDRMCEMCIGEDPKRETAECPDAVCPLRLFCRAKLAPRAAKRMPISADESFSWEGAK